MFFLFRVNLITMFAKKNQRSNLAVSFNLSSIKSLVEYAILVIIVKCFQSNRSSVQHLQSPHPTHHIFNFTTFPIGHTPTITQNPTCSPIKPHPASTAKEANHTTSQLPLRKIKVNVNAVATQFLIPTLRPQHRLIQQIPATPS